ncbi:hypothetical protein K438DRAFT_1784676 [Mycena galopus ATCC 62051]|nr:hypothetical protein K438DRAFT_1784676 [Mycena galopus ATCC 62051]
MALTRHCVIFWQWSPSTAHDKNAIWRLRWPLCNLFVMGRKARLVILGNIRIPGTEYSTLHSRAGHILKRGRTRPDRCSLALSNVRVVGSTRKTRKWERQNCGMCSNQCRSQPPGAGSLNDPVGILVEESRVEIFFPICCGECGDGGGRKRSARSHGP